MNTAMIRYVLGNVMKIEAALMLLPCMVALIYKENEGFSFLITLLLVGAIGCLASYKKPKSYVFYLKEGCIATALSWVVLSICGCLPFVISGDIPNFVDALFETISGFTTTGSSILSDVESLAKCSLFWRSFTHWIGGMGVLVFLLAVIPLSGGSHINLMRAESPGPSVGKLVPKIRYTARILYLIYVGMTIIEIVLLIVGGMSIFDSVTMSFGTAGTGGFGIKNDSMISNTPYEQWVVTIFMLLFGVNFNAYYFILLKQIGKALKMEEVKYYFLIVFSSIAIIFVNLIDTLGATWENLRHSSFQVASIITTTGFCTTDFDLWPQTAKTVLVILMFIGACAGSTGGGIKVSRIVILIKSIGKELNSYIHPKSVKKINMDGKPVEHEVVRSINVYFITYVVIFVISVLFVSLEGHDLTTNFTAVASALNNIGPGLSKVGPVYNFGFLSDFTKITLMFDMLAGRLELFPLLILFHPSVWADAIHCRKKVNKN